MKKLFFVLFFLVYGLNTSPNPITIFYISEFMFDGENGWNMEIVLPGYEDSISLNEYYLTSMTDTVYFKDGIWLYRDKFNILTQDNLVSALEINKETDIVTLFHSGEDFLDDIAFGTEYGRIMSPKNTQSICNEYFTGIETGYSGYYLDNSPTLGFENDTLNIKGNIQGYITDSNDNPVRNIKICYKYRDYFYNLDTLFVLTDENGYFEINEYASLIRLDYVKDTLVDRDVIQIWPDSTLIVEKKLNIITSVIEELPSNIIDGFELSQNYPNPFNITTSFTYTIPENDFVEINIYDEKGELVKKLFSGEQTAGKFKATWDADNISSGVYIYEIKTSKNFLTKKCILLK